MCHTACKPYDPILAHQKCVFYRWQRGTFPSFCLLGGRRSFDPVRENLDSATDSNKSCLMVLEAGIRQLGRSTVDIIFYKAFIKLFTLVADASLAAKSQFIYIWDRFKQKCTNTCSCFNSVGHNWTDQIHLMLKSISVSFMAPSITETSYWKGSFWVAAQ